MYTYICMINYNSHTSPKGGIPKEGSNLIMKPHEDHLSVTYISSAERQQQPPRLKCKTRLPREQSAMGSDTPLC